MIPAQATSRPGPELDDRTKELKAKLLGGKAQRGQSGTLPITPAVTIKPVRNVDGTNLTRDSPIHPASISSSGETESVSVTAEDVEGLLSELRPVSDDNFEKEKPQPTSKFTAEPQSTLKIEDATLSAHNVTTPSPHNLSKSSIRDISLTKTPNGKSNRKLSNGEGSDASEGEIREEQVSDTIQSFPSMKDTRNAPYLQTQGEKTVLRNRKEDTGVQIHEAEGYGTSPKTRTPVQTTRAPLRHVNENHESSEERQEKTCIGPDGVDVRRIQKESEHRDLSRRASSEDHRRHEVKYDSRREDVIPEKPVITSLEQLLAVDEDLKEWLEITGYHKTEYRNKTLSRRRALAALDAQRAKMDEEREKLLQELETHERGGGLLAGSTPSKIIPTPMLPPPIPNKTSISPMLPREEALRDNNERPSKQETGTKRNYDDYRDSRIENSAEKSGRLDEAGRGYRIKSETEDEGRRSYPADRELSHRHSPPPDSRPYHQEDKDISQKDDRIRDRGRSADHAASPGLQAYHSRPPARSMPDDIREREDRGERKDPRPYVVIGNYRGRDYDPNYRGRGRGRGNWASHSSDREQQLSQTHEPHSPERRTHAQRSADGTISKNMIKWNKGGRGG